MVTDVERRDLFQALETSLGEGPARVMMELLPPVGWADVARQSDLVAVRGEMAQLRGEIGELRGEMAELRGELKGEIAELRGEIKAQLPTLITANIASMIGVAGLVLAAAKFT